MFELSNNDRVDFLVENYNNAVFSINAVYAELEKYKSVERYMSDGRKTGYAPKKDALSAVLKGYWNEFYNTLNFRDFLSSDRKKEFENMMDGDLPEYSVENLKATAMTLYTDLEKYYVEKVDSLFKRLSGEHVTNKPSGFSERMIYKYVWDCPFHRVRYQAGDEIHDLRSVIFTILGKPVPSRNDTSNLLGCIYEVGEWYDFDSGAFRIKVFKNGNAHFEVHPYIAVKLNEVLAKLYPTSIPDKFRTVTKKIKEFEYIENQLSSSEMSFIESLARGKSSVLYIEEFQKQIIYSLGGSFEKRDRLQYGHKIGTYYEINFPYSIQPAIREILKRGSLGDYKSFQFYPTPDDVCDDAVEILKHNITKVETVLEPSGGTGSLIRAVSRKMGIDIKVDTIEINPIHCKILENVNITDKVINDDFLKIEPTKQYDVVLMNPPYSLNRWMLHIEHALKFSDNIVAILPTGTKSKVVEFAEQNGYNAYVQGEYDNFDKTKIKVSLYHLVKNT